MTAGDGADSKAQAAVWCGKCGIPYAADTVYCANCGAELAPLDAVAAALTSEPARSTRPTTPDPVFVAAPCEPTISATMTSGAVPPLAGHLQEQPPGQVAGSPAPAMPTLDEAFPNPPRGLLGRVRQRQQAMSDVEVDAAAAAIIAQARVAEVDAGAPRDALTFLAQLGPDPVVEAALRRRRDRDRAWLIGGIVCCVLLILFALAVSRYMSVGILRQ